MRKLFILLLLSLLPLKSIAFLEPPDPGEVLGEQIGNAVNAVKDYHKSKREFDAHLNRQRAAVRQCKRCPNRKALILEVDKSYYGTDYLYALFKMGWGERVGRASQILFGNYEQYYPVGCGYYHSEWSKCMGKYIYGASDRSDPRFQLFPSLDQIPTAVQSCQAIHNRLRLCRYLKDETFQVDGKPFLDIPVLDNEIAKAQPRKTSLHEQQQQYMLSGRAVGFDYKLELARRQALEEISARVSQDRKPILSCTYKLEKAPGRFYIEDGQYHFEEIEKGGARYRTYLFWNKTYPLTQDEANIVPQSSFWRNLGRNAVSSCPENVYKAELQRKQNNASMVMVSPEEYSNSLAKLKKQRYDFAGNYRVSGTDNNGKAFTATATIKRAQTKYNDAEYYYVVYSDKRLNSTSISASRYRNTMNLVMGSARLQLDIRNENTIHAEMLNCDDCMRSEVWTRDSSAPTLATPNMTLEEYSKQQTRAYVNKLLGRQQSGANAKPVSPARPAIARPKPVSKASVPDSFIGNWTGTWYCGFAGRRPLDVSIDKSGMVFSFGVSRKARKVPPGKIQYTAKGVRDWKYSHAVTYKSVKFKPVKWLQESKKNLFVEMELNYNPKSANKLTANVRHVSCRTLELTRR